MEYVELTNMCMIEDEKTGRVLVQNRIKPGWRGIAFPGGHIEPFEAVTDSVIREVKEETGLDITNITLCGVKDWCGESKRYIVFLFKTSTYSGELLERTDEGEVFWTPIESIHSLPLADGFDKMLQVFLDEKLNENFIQLDSKNGEWLHLLK